MTSEKKDPPLPLSALRPLGPNAPSLEEVEAERNSWFAGEPRAGEGTAVFETQKLHRVTWKDRRRMTLAQSVNRRRRAWVEAEEEARRGPQACRSCGAEPCGVLWPEARCCRRCSHEPVRRWQLTHVLWFCRKSYYVMEVNTGPAFRPESDEFAEGHPGRKAQRERQRHRQETRDAVYYRSDGVIQWVRRARTHYFLGARVSVVDFSRQLPSAADLERFKFETLDARGWEESLVERERQEDERDRSAETHPAYEGEDDATTEDDDDDDEP